MNEFLQGVLGFIRAQVSNDIYLRTFGASPVDVLLLTVAEVGDASEAVSQGIAVAGDGGWFEAVDDGWNTLDGWFYA
jgi:hypothetical protein